jgi:hypothetical protein
MSCLSGSGSQMTYRRLRYRLSAVMKIRLFKSVVVIRKNDNLECTHAKQYHHLINSIFNNPFPQAGFIRDNLEKVLRLCDVLQ